MKKSRLKSLNCPGVNSFNWKGVCVFSGVQISVKFVRRWLEGNQGLRFI